MKNPRTKLLLSLFTLLALASCAKDRTVDDWRRDQARRKAAEIQDISDVYRGMLISSKDKSVLGALTMDIKPDNQPSDSPNLPSSEPRAYLRADVTILSGGKTLTYPFRNGYYDSGAFKVNANVPNGGAKNLQMEISGTISGETLNGRLELPGFPGSGGEFTLKRRGPEQIPGSDSNGLPEQLNDDLNYAATAKFTDGKDTQVFMRIRRNPSTPEGDFYDLFSPLRLRVVTIYISQLTSVTFEEAEWDQRTRRLTGRNSTGSLKQMLDCDERRGGPGLPKLQWECRYGNNLGTIFTATFTQEEQ